MWRTGDSGAAWERIDGMDGDFCNPRYLRSPESDDPKWTALKSPTLSQGGTMGYDKVHRLLYSSNLAAGLWRVAVH